MRSQKEWRRQTDTEEETFNKLKVILSTPPVLAYPNFDLPFELHTDASGLGAVQNHQHDDTKHVIAYMAYTLRQSSQGTK